MRRKLFLFAVQLVPIFAVFLWIYPHVRPGYERIVVAAADVALHRLSPPIHLELTPDGGWKYLTLEPDGTKSFYFYRPGENLTLVYLSLALLPAMLLATPVSIPRRLRILGWGLVLLFVLHVLAAFGLVISIRCLAATPDSLPCRWIKTGVNTQGQLASVAIWGLLTWDVWLPTRPDQGSELV